MSNNSADHIITCRDCGSDFVHAVDEQIFFQQKGYPPPKDVGRVASCAGRDGWMSRAEVKGKRRQIVSLGPGRWRRRFG